MSERVQRRWAPLDVLLDVDVDTALPRGEAAGAGSRPLARERDAFERLGAAARDVRGDGGRDRARRTPRRHCAARCRISSRWSRPTRPAHAMIWATAASGDYPVWVGSGMLGGELWPLERGASRRFFVTDETRGAHCAPSGSVGGRQRSRSRRGASTSRCQRRAGVGGARRSARLTRADHVVALGGGVVGDLAGFCAATYQRGMPVVQRPDDASSPRSTRPTVARPGWTSPEARTTSASTTSRPA